MIQNRDETKKSFYTNFSKQQGFSIVEIAVAMAILLVILALTVPTLTATIRWTRLKQDLSNIETLIGHTMNQGLSRSTTSMLVINEGVMEGYYLDEQGNWFKFDEVVLEHCTFGRQNSHPTPWLDLVEKDISSFLNDTIYFNNMGVVDPPGGAIFLNLREYDATVEILSSGMVTGFYRAREDETWIQ